MVNGHQLHGKSSTKPPSVSFWCCAFYILMAFTSFCEIKCTGWLFCFSDILLCFLMQEEGSNNIIRVIISRRMMWIWRKIHGEENSHKSLVRKPKGKKSTGGLRTKWKDYIKNYLKNTEHELDFAGTRQGKWWAPVITVINLQVS
jgi:hypothetical protein